MFPVSGNSSWSSWRAIPVPEPRPAPLPAQLTPALSGAFPPFWVQSNQNQGGSPWDGNTGIGTTFCPKAAGPGEGEGCSPSPGSPGTLLSLHPPKFGVPSQDCSSHTIPAVLNNSWPLCPSREPLFHPYKAPSPFPLAPLEALGLFYGE